MRGVTGGCWRAVARVGDNASSIRSHGHTVGNSDAALPSPDGYQPENED